MIKSMMGPIMAEIGCIPSRKKEEKLKKN